jgi:hypothetical protein
MKLTKGQIEALADEVVERLTKVDVLEIGTSKLKTEWKKVQDLHEKIKAKEKEVEVAQDVVYKLEAEQETLEADIKKAKHSLETKYGVRVKKEYDDDLEESGTVLKLTSDLGSGIHAKLQRQITLLSIDENIDDLTADQLISKIVEKHLKS